MEHVETISNIISVGTGKIMHRLPFVWITDRNDVSYLDDVYIGGNQIERLSGWSE